MDRAYVFQQIKEHLEEMYNVDEAVIVESATLVDLLGKDPEEGVKIVLAIEDQFEIQITDEEVQSIKTLKQFVDLVMKKTGSR
jgi:acyl carrier protein